MCIHIKHCHIFSGPQAIEHGIQTDKMLEICVSDGATFVSIDTSGILFIEAPWLRERCTYC